MKMQQDLSNLLCLEITEVNRKRTSSYIDEETLHNKSKFIHNKDNDNNDKNTTRSSKFYFMQRIKTNKFAKKRENAPLF